LTTRPIKKDKPAEIKYPSFVNSVKKNQNKKSKTNAIPPTKIYLNNCREFEFVFLLKRLVKSSVYLFFIVYGLVKFKKLSLDISYRV
jgi:hypothetical protein